MDQERFTELVSQAIDALPTYFLDRLDNVDVVVEDNPTPEQLGKVKSAEGKDLLLGLYEGVPLTGRTTGYNMVLPDKITLFQKSIEKICRNDSEVSLQIQKTLKHEIAHHFGISDERLEEFEGDS
jgi:predicted Zn-dependent protease with MMP-like domain